MKDFYTEDAGGLGNHMPRQKRAFADSLWISGDCVKKRTLLEFERTWTSLVGVCIMFGFSENGLRYCGYESRIV